MRYPTAQQFRAALEDRLRQHARTTNLPFIRLRKEVVFDRLLARLMAVAPHRWILKGGLALDYRLGNRARLTKDMDLGRQDDVEAATADLMAAAALDLDDYFRYAIERTDALAELDDGAAVRYRVRAELAGRLFEQVVVDVGFDAMMLRTADLVRGRGLLAFAGLESIEIPAIPLAYHIAEKVHAYTRQYGPGGRESTRVKDLVDLVLIATEKSSTLRAHDLHDALIKTFTRRNTHPLPSTLPASPSGWTIAYGRIAEEVGLAKQIDVGHACVAAFLDPILSETYNHGAIWQPDTATWSIESL